MEGHTGQASAAALPVLSPPGAISPGRLMQIARERLEVAERDRGEAESVDSSSTEDGGVSLQLDDLNIATVPVELVELLRTRIAKLSLKKNWLVGLPNQFVYMDRLTYLDIAQNHLGEVPQVVCYLASLEILDISGNQIRRLPKEIVNLPNLKVLSMANNRFEYLPAFIADVPELTYLEFYGNPIIFPPPEVVEAERAKHGDDVAWIRQYLKGHKNQLLSLADSAGRSWSVGSGQHAAAAAAAAASTEAPQPAERSRSNSETTIHGNAPASSSSLRAAKRMGFVSRKQRATVDDSGSNSGSSAGSASIDVSGQHSHSQSQSQSHSRMQSMETPGLGLGLTTGDRALSTGHGDANAAPPPIPPVSVKRAGSTHAHGERSRGNSFSTSPPLDNAPNAYFRRLSTLQEDEHMSGWRLDHKILVAIRKILYSVYEFHDMARRCSAFCTDKAVAASLSQHLRMAQTTFPELVKALESHETNGRADGSQLLEIAGRCMAAVGDLVAFFRANIERLSQVIDIKFVRSLIMVSFTSFNELHNAWTTLYPQAITTTTSTTAASTTASTTTHLTPQSTASSSSATTAGASAHQNDDLAAADDHLYERIYLAAQAAQSVLGQLTSIISKNAIQASQGNSLGAGASEKIKELGTVSLAGIDVTRRLKSRMDLSRETGHLDRKKFWDDANAFLKSVISILSSTKSVMNDVPFLVEVRPNLTTLTRAAKEIPLLLELSSYRAMMSDSSNGQQQPNPPQSQPQNPPPGQTPGPQPLLATPLAAVLGPAAQAVMSPTVQSSSYMMQSPFIPQEPTMGDN